MYSRIVFLVPPDRCDEVPPRPEVLSHEIPLPFGVHPRQADGALPLDEADDLRHRVLRGIEISMDMIGLRMPSSIRLSFCPANRMKYFAEMLPERSTERLAPSLRKRRRYASPPGTLAVEGAPSLPIFNEIRPRSSAPTDTAARRRARERARPGWIRHLEGEFRSSVPSRLGGEGHAIRKPIVQRADATACIRGGSPFLGCRIGSSPRRSSRCAPPRAFCGSTSTPGTSQIFPYNAISA